MLLAKLLSMPMGGIMKKYLMVTPQLVDELLAENVYEPVDNSFLLYGPTHFPAIPLINSSVEDGDEIEVITVTYDIPSCHRNLELLKSEVGSVCASKSAICRVTSIEVPFDDSIQAVLDVYTQLIAHFEDGDALYADITYGSKPMPIVLIMALQYAYRIKDDVSIECVVYGQISHHKETKDAKIFDVTALVQLDEIVRLMADGNVSDPASVIDLIIGE